MALATKRRFTDDFRREAVALWRIDRSAGSLSGRRLVSSRHDQGTLVGCNQSEFLVPTLVLDDGCAFTGSGATAIRLARQAAHLNLLPATVRPHA